jgi:two-component system response regulator
MNHKGIEILLVEDDPDDLDLALMAIKSHNIANNVLVARDGAEALDVIFCTGEHRSRRIEDGPRLVLLDLNLPKIDGIEVLRRIKSDPVTQSIPVVVMTSSKQEQDVNSSYKYGANSYIVKPVDFVQFSETVCRLGFYWLILNVPPIMGSQEHNPNLSA